MEASQAEKNVFGADVRIHPITKMPIEQGIGALPVDRQVEHHLAHIERTGGKHLADAMRHKLSADTAAQQADTILIEEEHGHDHD